VIDAPLVLRTFLVAQAPLEALVDTRLWERRTVPPPGYKPTDGYGIAFRSRGGRGFDYSGAVYHQSWAFKCYGLDEADSGFLYRTLVDVLQDRQGYGILSAALEVSGQNGEEPSLGWHYTVCYFETLMLATYELA
jgi:hypothetical protein